jgi:hypothetical protein
MHVLVCDDSPRSFLLSFLLEHMPTHVDNPQCTLDCEEFFWLLRRILADAFPSLTSSISSSLSSSSLALASPAGLPSPAAAATTTTAVVSSATSLSSPMSRGGDPCIPSLSSFGVVKGGELKTGGSSTTLMALTLRLVEQLKGHQSQEEAGAEKTDKVLTGLMATLTELLRITPGSRLVAGSSSQGAGLVGVLFDEFLFGITKTGPRREDPNVKPWLVPVDPQRPKCKSRATRAVVCCSNPKL